MKNVHKQILLISFFFLLIFQCFYQSPILLSGLQNLIKIRILDQQLKNLSSQNSPDLSQAIPSFEKWVLKEKTGLSQFLSSEQELHVEWNDGFSQHFRRLQNLPVHSLMKIEISKDNAQLKLKLIFKK